MAIEHIPLSELSIDELYNKENNTYEIPIYQRNYAWRKKEITTLIQDVYNAFKKEGQPRYFIGTLVSYEKGNQTFEIIDGQQRLTTINLILHALKAPPKSKLTYRARANSNRTIQHISEHYNTLKENPFPNRAADTGLIDGYHFAIEGLKEIDQRDIDSFKYYFQNHVHIIHYKVPKDIDLNKYFEIMNSRGEQLEKHEIIKARLLAKLNDNTDKARFNMLWESCSDMAVFIQRKYHAFFPKHGDAIFGKDYGRFTPKTFAELPASASNTYKRTINHILEADILGSPVGGYEVSIPDFQPIIDFTNFLLIVLKITRMDDPLFTPKSFSLVDTELIVEFDNIKSQITEDWVKIFGYNLLKTKFLLDNYIVHSVENTSTQKGRGNPWALQSWLKGNKSNENGPKNTVSDLELSQKLTQVLSMFEVSFTPHQRKNYLFYCLHYLFNAKDLVPGEYYTFVSRLAEKYLKDIYLKQENLTSNNTPKRDIFDETLIKDGSINTDVTNNTLNFVSIYGDGSIATKGIPLFVFNYLDYKLWEKYVREIRGEDTQTGYSKRNEFFASLGCPDFGKDSFNEFYQSRTRNSLEHYYPQAQATGEEGSLNKDQINCFGNFAYISSDANSTGSDKSPYEKIRYYLNTTSKDKQVQKVSISSLKFLIMMEYCRQQKSWNYKDIQIHQTKMIDILIK